MKVVKGFHDEKPLLPNAGQRLSTDMDSIRWLVPGWYYLSHVLGMYALAGWLRVPKMPRENKTTSHHARPVHLPRMSIWIHSHYGDNIPLDKDAAPNMVRYRLVRNEPEAGDEFTFRFNRRKSKSRGLLFYRLLEQSVITAPISYNSLVLDGSWL